MILKTHYSDSEIIEVFKNGKPQATDKVLKYLYKKYYPKVCAFVTSNSGNNAEAADVFQDALIAFYTQVRKGAFKGKSAISSYIYGIARNTWLTELKKSNKSSTVSVNDSLYQLQDNVSNVSFSIQNNVNLFSKLFDQLGAEGKRILTYYYYEGLTVKEIQQSLSLGSEQSVKTKKYRCMKKLINIFKENNISKEHFIN